MFCPYCGIRTAGSWTAARPTTVPPSGDGGPARPAGRRFTRQETVILMVGKRSGATDPSPATKIVNGVRRACQGRRVTENQLAILAQQVEDEMRSRGCAEVPSHEVGLAILGPLRELDEGAEPTCVSRRSTGVLSHSPISRTRSRRCARPATGPGRADGHVLAP